MWYVTHRRPREAVVSIMKEHLNGMISEFENNTVNISYTSVPASSRIPFKADNSIGATITADSGLAYAKLLLKVKP